MTGREIIDGEWTWNRLRFWKLVRISCKDAASDSDWGFDSPDPWKFGRPNHPDDRARRDSCIHEWIRGEHRWTNLGTVPGRHADSKASLRSWIVRSFDAHSMARIEAMIDAICLPRRANRPGQVSCGRSKNRANEPNTAKMTADWSVPQSPSATNEPIDHRAGGPKGGRETKKTKRISVSSILVSGHSGFLALGPGEKIAESPSVSLAQHERDQVTSHVCRADALHAFVIRIEV
jgi:hypothetical protein